MDQAGNQLHDLIPGQAYIVTAVFLVAQALSIVIFATVRCTGQCVGASAGSVFLPEKRGFFLVGMGLLEKGINTPFASCKAAAARKGRADLILRNKLLNRRNLCHFS